MIKKIELLEQNNAIQQQLLKAIWKKKIRTNT